jgi:hypothetical protein
MEGYPAVNLDYAYNMQYVYPLVEEAKMKASVGDFDGAEGLLWSIAAIVNGSGPGPTEDDPPYVHEASERVVSNPTWGSRGVACGKSRIPPRDPSAGLEWMVSAVDAAKAKWEEGAPARAAEWEKGAPVRKAAEEVARLKAEIARVEQEEVNRQAALVKEADLEKLRIQNEEEEKQRKAEVTSLERDAAALREKLAAMKELMAMKAADPLAYAAVCASPSPTPAPPHALSGAPRKRPAGGGEPMNSEEKAAWIRAGEASTAALRRARALMEAAVLEPLAYAAAAAEAEAEAKEARDAYYAMRVALAAAAAARTAKAAAAEVAAEEARERYRQLLRRLQAE